MSEYVGQFISILAPILYVALLARVIMSWINVGPSSPIYPLATIVYQVTEPILAPIRRVLPKFGMFDLSPMVALLLVGLVQSLFP